MSVHEIPLVRIVIPFALGIVLKVQGVNLAWSITTIGLLFLLLLLYASSKYFGIVYRFRTVFGFISVFLLVGMGASIVQFRRVANTQNHYRNYLNDAKVAFVRILEPVQEKENSIRIVANVEAIDHQKTQGKSIVYLFKDEQSKKLEIGDLIVVKSKFNEIEGPKNPGEFNYKQFLRNKQINHQLYAGTDDWKLLEKDRNSIFYFAEQARKKLLSILKSNGIEDNQFGVASALLLGSKDNLDYNLMKSYAGAGAMHVLAVSGLHVGIIYLILTTLLSFLNKVKRGVLIQASIIILLLWFYALLTGLSPSVMRASTMFSFIVIGNAVHRKTNIYNTLAASALLLLFINPYLLYEVGFQLSYLAVIGIVYFQPKIYRLIYTKWWLLDKIWAITAVSIAAQITTLPLTLYYFHQFPVYFMLANIVVIPAATIILGMGILLFLTSPLEIVSQTVGWLLNMFIGLLNSFITAIQDLPGAIFNGVSISILEVFLLFVVIVFVAVYSASKKLKWINWGLAICILLIMIDEVEDYELKTKNEIVVHSVKKHSALNFVQGEENHIVTDNILWEDDKKMDFHIRPYWNALDVNNTGFSNWETKASFLDSTLSQTGNFFQFHDHKLVRLTENKFKRIRNEKFQVDYLLLSENPKLSIADLYNVFDFDYLLLDASNSSWYINKIELEAKELNASLVDVYRNGSFQVSVK